MNHIEVNVAAFVKCKDRALGQSETTMAKAVSVRIPCAMTSSVKDGVSLAHAAPRQRKMDHFEGRIWKNGDELFVISLLDVPTAILNENGEANRFTTASFGFNHTNLVASQAVPEQRDGEMLSTSSSEALRMSNRKWNQVCIRSSTLRCHPVRRRCLRSSQTVPESRQGAQQLRLWLCKPSVATTVYSPGDGTGIQSAPIDRHIAGATNTSLTIIPLSALLHAGVTASSERTKGAGSEMTTAVSTRQRLSSVIWTL